MMKFVEKDGVLVKQPATLFDALNPTVLVADVETGLIRLAAVVVLVSLLRD